MATEKRLMGYDPITLESFTRHITKHREPYDHYDMGYVDAVDQIEDWLDANTVDAVEVVHGRWVDGFTVRCSVCNGYAPMDEDNDAWFTPYCPNCAAMMDGDKDG